MRINLARQLLPQLRARDIAIFDKYLISPIVIYTVTGFELLFVWKYTILEKAHRDISTFVHRYSAMHALSRDENSQLIWQMFRSNSYTILPMLILWILLFKVYTGSDLIMSYVPIHPVDTFEISRGCRIVLSPITANDTTMFSTAILPLKDIAFLKFIANQGIKYRQAVNLSELSPILSAAHTIETNSNNQSADALYFENYDHAVGST